MHAFPLATGSGHYWPSLNNSSPLISAHVTDSALLLPLEATCGHMAQKAMCHFQIEALRTSVLFPVEAIVEAWRWCSPIQEVPAKTVCSEAPAQLQWVRNGSSNMFVVSVSEILGLFVTAALPAPSWLIYH